MCRENHEKNKNGSEGMNHDNRYAQGHAGQDPTSLFLS